MEKIKVGDVFINFKGAIIKIVEPDINGRPQYNIASSFENYDKGLIECRAMADYKNLAIMLKENHYNKLKNF